jgi:hypothetical protein
MLPCIRVRWWPGAVTVPLLLWLCAASMSAEAPPSAGPLRDAAEAARLELNARHPDEVARIERGTGQVLRYWREDDGGPAELQQFLKEEFIPRGEALDATFARFEFALERVGGYMNSLGRDLRRGVDLDLGPQLALDGRLAAWEPASHVADDLFKHKLAFVALLNFPLTTLAERVRDGQGWSRRQWAETRLAGQFTARVPSDVQAGMATAFAEAESYINGYNVYMHHVLTREGRRLFKPGLRLISHWNLRDELKAAYAEKDGLERQRLIALVMDKIVRQEIPLAAINNPLLDWTPETGKVVASTVHDAEAPASASATPDAAREPDTRYARWKAIFDAQRRADAYAPDNPTYLDRRFNVDREIPETEVRALFEAVLSSPVGARTGRLVAQRLGRPLEPHDIWYAGFKPRAEHSESELDALTRARYPTPEAYAADMPRLLTALGFSAERARFLTDHIAVDPSRGAGHALGARRRDDQAHLRTRVGASGMDYKGYNIAVHEMGHTVEQVFSVTTIDHSLLMGVPNNAFTEALAFVFQARDMELLGLGQRDAGQRHLRTLETFWSAREIAGVALVDMDSWHWLYAHPDATPAEFRAAVVTIAQDVWNRHFAAIFGRRDSTLLAIYSHLVNYGLYMPDYPLGYLIAFQVEAHFAKLAGPMGPEFERICQLGSITPDAWMRQAVGAPLSAGPLLTAVDASLKSQEQAAKSR